MAVVTICSDFGAPKNKVIQCFHCFTIYLPWSDGTRCHDLSFLVFQTRHHMKSKLQVNIPDVQRCNNPQQILTNWIQKCSQWTIQCNQVRFSLGMQDNFKIHKLSNAIQLNNQKKKEKILRSLQYMQKKHLISFHDKCSQQIKYRIN